MYQDPTATARTCPPSTNADSRALDKEGSAPALLRFVSAALLPWIRATLIQHPPSTRDRCSGTKQSDRAPCCYFCRHVGQINADAAAGAPACVIAIAHSLAVLAASPSDEVSYLWRSSCATRLSFVLAGHPGPLSARAAVPVVYSTAGCETT
jgi:hypothetical protein